jgi:hypothetical protein
MSEQNDLTTDVLIIGAGLAGLMAATVLQNAGIQVTVVDKGRSVGGRMATRRIGPGIADHGAQFFTVRENKFQEWVDRWQDEDLVFVWSNGFSDGSLIDPDYEGHPRYAVRGGMNALAKRIARDLSDIRLERQIVTATYDDQGWIFQDDEGELLTSRALIMTPPVPQSLAILEAGASNLAEDDFAALARITYAQNLTGMFWIEGRATLPRPGAVQRRNTNIIWIGDNQQKGISPEAQLVTVQAGEQYSRQMWNAPDRRILNSMRTALQIFMGENATIRQAQLKRWRYSRPLVVHPDRYLFATLDGPPLIFAGDAFGGPRVEGAVMSGLAAGEAMANLTG